MRRAVRQTGARQQAATFIQQGQSCKPAAHTQLTCCDNEEGDLQQQQDSLERHLQNSPNGDQDAAD
jgi:hypothetical protein